VHIGGGHGGVGKGKRRRVASVRATQGVVGNSSVPLSAGPEEDKMDARTVQADAFRDQI
jgi:hypothetical protein